MKIKFGAIVVDGSGKLGGHVFAKNRGGHYMRTKVTPSNPNTTFQVAVRVLFALISSGWSSLTNAQRLSFSARVGSYQTTNIFGDSKSPSAKALHQKLNQNLGNSGQALIEVCPDPSAVPSALIDSCTGDLAAPDLAFNVSGDTTGSKLLIFATPPLSQGTTHYKNKLRVIGVVDGANAAEIQILTLYTARFGSLSAGDNVYCGIQVCNTGGLTSPLEVVKAFIA